MHCSCTSLTSHAASLGRVLLTAIEDGDSLPELADSLEDFVPHASRQALAAGLRELAAAVQTPPSSSPQPAYAWLQPAGQEVAQQAAPGGQQADPPSSAATDAGQPQQVQQQVPQAARSTSLSAAAVEFKPAAAPVAAAAGLATLHLGSGAGAAQQDAQAGSSSWAGSEAEEAAADAATAHEKVAGGPAAEAAFLAVLGEQFPLFSAAALAQLFQEQGCSLAATIHTLCGLEAEIEGQATAAAAMAGGPKVSIALGVVGRQQAVAVALCCQYAAMQLLLPVPVVSASLRCLSLVLQAGGPAFTAEDFPSLGSPAAAVSPASQAGSTAGYASKARAAADLPAQPRSGARQRPSAAAAARTAAPIWQAQGVQQFATGAAAAKEYAELRAEARDHARLRNACFQQVGAWCAAELYAARCWPVGSWLPQPVDVTELHVVDLQFCMPTRVQSQAGVLTAKD